MTYFQELTVQLRQLGIFRSDCSAKAKKIAIISRCGFVVIFVLIFLTHSYYFVYEVQSSRERSESALCMLGISLSFSWYLTLLFQSNKYMTLLNELGSIIQDSE